ncbi:MAG: hypothetical protein WB807_13730 [Candidatus Dormiibacterota bacterium]
MELHDFHQIWRGRPRKFAALTAVMLGSALLGARPASATTFTVCGSGCAYSQIGPAVAAANSGDTVSIGPGRYVGGFTIDQSLSLVGAGAHETTISGGGPVITVGKFGATTEPTVALRDLAITGGVTASSPVSIAYVAKAGVIALGGGIFVPPAANFAAGATLTVSNSVIAGNTAAPTASVDAGFSCGTHDCRFAQAGGGGIDNWGRLTVDNTIVSNNKSAGAFASDADGAGIYTQQGALTVRNSVVTGNRATAIAPDGRFAEGAGIMVDTTASAGTCTPCTLSIQSSIVRDNSSSLVNNTLPSSVGAQSGMNANAGGIHVGDGIPTTVKNTVIDGNSATAIDLRGALFGIDAGMIVGYSPLDMQNTQVDDNRSTTTELTSTGVGPAGSALELDGGGTISGTSIDGNVAISTSPGGLADTNGGLAVFYFGNPGGARLVTVRNSDISGNVTESFSKTGSAQVEGGAVFNNSLLVMRNVHVSDNVGRAEAPIGAAQGGGIWNSVDASTGASPPAQLTLENTSVTHNALEGRAGVTLQGGGIFTASPATLTLTNTQIAFNRPDQCFGC